MNKFSATFEFFKKQVMDYIIRIVDMKFDDNLAIQ